MTHLPEAFATLLAPVNQPISLAVVIDMVEARGWVWRVGTTTFSRSHHRYEAAISRLEADERSGDLEVVTVEHDGDTALEALAWALVDTVNAAHGEALA